MRIFAVVLIVVGILVVIVGYRGRMDAFLQAFQPKAAK
jgi:hypothetical protein